MLASRHSLSRTLSQNSAPKTSDNGALKGYFNMNNNLADIRSGQLAELHLIVLVVLWRKINVRQVDIWFNKPSLTTTISRKDTFEPLLK